MHNHTKYFLTAKRIQEMDRGRDLSTTPPPPPPPPPPLSLSGVGGRALAITTTTTTPSPLYQTPTGIVAQPSSSHYSISSSHLGSGGRVDGNAFSVASSLNSHSIAMGATGGPPSPCYSSIERVREAMAQVRVRRALKASSGAVSGFSGSVSTSVSNSMSASSKHHGANSSKSRTLGASKASTEQKPSSIDAALTRGQSPSTPASSKHNGANSANSRTLGTSKASDQSRLPGSIKVALTRGQSPIPPSPLLEGSAPASTTTKQQQQAPQRLFSTSSGSMASSGVSSASSASPVRSPLSPNRQQQQAPIIDDILQVGNGGQSHHSASSAKSSSLGQSSSNATAAAASTLTPPSLSTPDKTTPVSLLSSSSSLSTSTAATAKTRHTSAQSRASARTTRSRDRMHQQHFATRITMVPCPQLSSSSSADELQDNVNSTDILEKKQPGSHKTSEYAMSPVSQHSNQPPLLRSSPKFTVPAVKTTMSPVSLGRSIVNEFSESSVAPGGVTLDMETLRNVAHFIDTLHQKQRLLAAAREQYQKQQQQQQQLNLAVAVDGSTTTDPTETGEPDAAVIMPSSSSPPPASDQAGKPLAVFGGLDDAALPDLDIDEDEDMVPPPPPPLSSLQLATAPPPTQKSLFNEDDDEDDDEGEDDENKEEEEEEKEEEVSEDEASDEDNNASANVEEESLKNGDDKKNIPGSLPSLMMLVSTEEHDCLSTDTEQIQTPRMANLVQEQDAMVVSSSPTYCKTSSVVCNLAGGKLASAAPSLVVPVTKPRQFISSWNCSRPNLNNDDDFQETFAVTASPISSSTRPSSKGGSRSSAETIYPKSKKTVIPDRPSTPMTLLVTKEFRFDRHVDDDSVGVHSSQSSSSLSVRHAGAVSQTQEDEYRQASVEEMPEEEEPIPGSEASISAAIVDVDGKDATDSVHESLLVAERTSFVQGEFVERQPLSASDSIQASSSESAIMKEPYCDDDDDKCKTAQNESNTSSLDYEEKQDSGVDDEYGSHDSRTAEHSGTSRWGGSATSAIIDHESVEVLLDPVLLHDVGKFIAVLELQDVAMAQELGEIVKSMSSELGSVASIADVARGDSPEVHFIESVRPEVLVAIGSFVDDMVQSTEEKEKEASAAAAAENQMSVSREFILMPAVEDLSTRTTTTTTSRDLEEEEKKDEEGVRRYTLQDAMASTSSVLSFSKDSNDSDWRGHLVGISGIVETEWIEQPNEMRSIEALTRPVDVRNSSYSTESDYERFNGEAGDSHSQHLIVVTPNRSNVSMTTSARLSAHKDCGASCIQSVKSRESNDTFPVGALVLSDKHDGDCELSYTSSALSKAGKLKPHQRYSVAINTKLSGGSLSVLNFGREENEHDFDDIRGAESSRSVENTLVSRTTSQEIRSLEVFTEGKGLSGSLSCGIEVSGPARKSSNSDTITFGGLFAEETASHGGSSSSTSQPTLSMADAEQGSSAFSAKSRSLLVGFVPSCHEESSNSDPSNTLCSKSTQTSETVSVGLLFNSHDDTDDSIISASTVSTKASSKKKQHARGMSITGTASSVARVDITSITNLFILGSDPSGAHGLCETPQQANGAALFAEVTASHASSSPSTAQPTLCIADAEHPSSASSGKTRSLLVGLAPSCHEESSNSDPSNTLSSKFTRTSETVSVGLLFDSQDGTESSIISSSTISTKASSKKKQHARGMRITGNGSSAERADRITCIVGPFSLVSYPSGTQGLCEASQPSNGAALFAEENASRAGSSPSTTQATLLIADVERPPSASSRKTRSLLVGSAPSCNEECSNSDPAIALISKSTRTSEMVSVGSLFDSQDGAESSIISTSTISTKASSKKKQHAKRIRITGNRSSAEKADRNTAIAGIFSLASDLSGKPSNGAALFAEEAASHTGSSPSMTQPTLRTADLKQRPSASSGNTPCLLVGSAASCLEECSNSVPINISSSKSTESSEGVSVGLLFYSQADTEHSIISASTISTSKKEQHARGMRITGTRLSTERVVAGLFSFGDDPSGTQGLVDASPPPTNVATLFAEEAASHAGSSPSTTKTTRRISDLEQQSSAISLKAGSHEECSNSDPCNKSHSTETSETVSVGLLFYSQNETENSVISTSTISTKASSKKKQGIASTGPSAERVVAGVFSLGSETSGTQGSQPTNGATLSAEETSSHAGSSLSSPQPTIRMAHVEHSPRSLGMAQSLLVGSARSCLEERSNSHPSNISSSKSTRTFETASVALLLHSQDDTDNSITSASPLSTKASGNKTEHAREMRITDTRSFTAKSDGTTSIAGFFSLASNSSETQRLCDSSQPTNGATSNSTEQPITSLSSSVLWQERTDPIPSTPGCQAVPAISIGALFSEELADSGRIFAEGLALECKPPGRDFFSLERRDLSTRKLSFDMVSLGGFFSQETDISSSARPEMRNIVVGEENSGCGRATEAAQSESETSKICLNDDVVSSSDLFMISDDEEAMDEQVSKGTPVVGMTPLRLENVRLAESYDKLDDARQGSTLEAVSLAGFRSLESTRIAGVQNPIEADHFGNDCEFPDSLEMINLSSPTRQGRDQTIPMQTLSVASSCGGNHGMSSRGSRHVEVGSGNSNVGSERLITKMDLDPPAEKQGDNEDCSSIAGLFSPSVLAALGQFIDAISSPEKAPINQRELEATYETSAQESLENAPDVLIAAVGEFIDCLSATKASFEDDYCFAVGNSADCRNLPRTRGCQNHHPIPIPEIDVDFTPHYRNSQGMHKDRNSPTRSKSNADALVSRATKQCNTTKSIARIDSDVSATSSQAFETGAGTTIGSFEEIHEKRAKSEKRTHMVPARGAHAATMRTVLSSDTCLTRDINPVTLAAIAEVLESVAQNHVVGKALRLEFSSAAHAFGNAAAWQELEGTTPLLDNCDLSVATEDIDPATRSFVERYLARFYAVASEPTSDKDDDLSSSCFPEEALAEIKSIIDRLQEGAIVTSSLLSEKPSPAMTLQPMQCDNRSTVHWQRPGMDPPSGFDMSKTALDRSTRRLDPPTGNSMEEETNLAPPDSMSSVGSLVVSIERKSSSMSMTAGGSRRSPANMAKSCMSDIVAVGEATVSHDIVGTNGSEEASHLVELISVEIVSSSRSEELEDQARDDAKYDNIAYQDHVDECSSVLDCRLQHFDRTGFEEEKKDEDTILDRPTIDYTSDSICELDANITSRSNGNCQVIDNDEDVEQKLVELESLRKLSCLLTGADEIPMDEIMYFAMFLRFSFPFVDGREPTAAAITRIFYEAKNMNISLNIADKFLEIAQCLLEEEQRIIELAPSDEISMRRVDCKICEKDRLVDFINRLAETAERVEKRPKLSPDDEYVVSNRANEEQEAIDDAKHVWGESDDSSSSTEESVREKHNPVPTACDADVLPTRSSAQLDKNLHGGANRAHPAEEEAVEIDLREGYVKPEFAPQDPIEEPWWEIAARLTESFESSKHSSTAQHWSSEGDEFVSRHVSRSVTVIPVPEPEDDNAESREKDDDDHSVEEEIDRFWKERQARVRERRYRFTRKQKPDKNALPLSFSDTDAEMTHGSLGRYPTLSSGSSWSMESEEEMWIRRRSMAKWTDRKWRPQQSWMKKDLKVNDVAVPPPQPINAVAAIEDLRKNGVPMNRRDVPPSQQWKLPYDRRISSHKGYLKVDLNSLFSASSVVPQPCTKDAHPWERRIVKQRFLYEQSISFQRNWFGLLREKLANKKVRQPICRPKSMEMPMKAGEWTDEWYKKPWVAPVESNLSDEAHEVQRTYAKYRIAIDGDNDDGSWEDTPECGRIKNVQLKIGERISRVTPDLTSSLRRSRWRKKHFPHGTFPY